MPFVVNRNLIVVLDPPGTFSASRRTREMKALPRDFLV